MGIFIRRKGGQVTPYWLGFWQEDGKRHETSLCRWEGTPPPPGEKYGDARFEQSRERAQRLFDEMRRGETSKAEELVLAQRVHVLRYGGKVERVKLAELRARWDALPHKADLTAERRERVHSVLSRFVAFMGERFPRVSEVGALTAEHFKAFLADVEQHGIPRKDAKGKAGKGKKAAPVKEEGGGVSARTWNDVLDILRGTLAKVDGQSKGFREYLAQLPRKTVATVHRRPFSGEELEAIFAAAAEIDPELRPVLVAAACTALRRGDVAQLKWEDVDMSAGFVTLKTSKTGETVEIPIFPPLLLVLQEAERKRRQGVPYVFPRIAMAYQRNPDGLNVRLRRVLEAAGFAKPPKNDNAGDKAKAKGKGKKGAAEETPSRKANAGKFPAPDSPAAAVEAIDGGMRRDGWTEERRQKGLAILQRHLTGEDGRTIAREMGIARGAVSSYLHEMEVAGEVALISPPKDETPRKAMVAEMRDGEQRKQRGSLCGWHSFRTTFCTLALANGVPMELLRKITGHRTAEIVLKHYDRRGREETRRAFGNAMPKAIAGAVAMPPAAAASPAATVGKADAADYEAVPADIAHLARMLANASHAQREEVARMLAQGGDGGGEAKGKRRARRK